MQESLLQLLYAALGSFGFGILFNIKLSRVIPTTIGGLICWATFLLAKHFSASIFTAAFISSATIAFYSEILARIFKAPTTVFTIISVIPLIPGSSLYYTMQYTVLNQWSHAKDFALETVLYIGAIALGISIVSAIFSILSKAFKGKAH